MSRPWALVLNQYPPLYQQREHLVLARRQPDGVREVMSFTMHPQAMPVRRALRA